ISRAQVGIAVRLPGVDGADIDGAARLRGLDRVADLEAALEAGELAAHRRDAEVLDGELHARVRGVDIPCAGRNEGGSGGGGHLSRAPQLGVWVREQSYR